MTQLTFIVFFWFYIGWFACIYLALTHYSSLSLLFPVLLLLFLHTRGLLNFKKIIFMLSVVVIGSTVDSVLFYFEFIEILGMSTILIPIWLLSIWMLYAICLTQLTKMWILPWWMASLLGFFIGPLSYKSGEYFNVLSFTHSSTFMIYAGFWALFFPISILIMRKFL